MDVIKALTFIYLVLCTLDALITTMLIKVAREHIELDNIESNPIAVVVIERFGISGMLLFKLVSSLVAVGCIMALHKVNHKRHSIFQRFIKPHHLMWLAIICAGICVLTGIAYTIMYMLPVPPLGS